MQIDFTAPLWRWQVRTDSWWFVTVPPDPSDELADLPLPPRGFGSIRVRVTVGSTTWTTSVFPSDKDAGYVLPMKKKVRDAEGLTAEQPVTVRIETIDV